MTRKIIVGVVSVLVLSSTQYTYAQDSVEMSTQEQCFTQLKSSVTSIPSFRPVHEQVKALSYSDVQTGLSDYYKNISSFGVDLRSPDFDMRVYSFGRETGYQHPPFSPFPTYTLSDKWKEPAKEFIIAEEYVRNTETNERMFISCAFMVVDTGSLKNVTAENYLFDGPLTSVLHTAADGSHKTWYSRNKSYDHFGMEIVTWERVFVYPKNTQNQFFDKYTIAGAFPSRKTDNLSNIVNNAKDLSGDKELLNPPELKGYDTVFSLNSYYQAIESTFPSFAKGLSLRGVLQYETVKELLATRGVSEFDAIWNTVLDPRDITRYALLKEEGKLVKDNGDGKIEINEISSFFEEQLLKIQSLTLEQDAQHLLKTVSERNPIVEPTETIETKGSSSLFEKYSNIIIALGLVSVALLGGLLVWLRKRRLENNVEE